MSDTKELIIPKGPKQDKAKDIKTAADEEKAKKRGAVSLDTLDRHTIDLTKALQDAANNLDTLAQIVKDTDYTHVLGAMTKTHPEFPSIAVINRLAATASGIKEWVDTKDVRTYDGNKEQLRNVKTQLEKILHVLSSTNLFKAARQDVIKSTDLMQQFIDSRLGIQVLLLEDDSSESLSKHANSKDETLSKLATDLKAAKNSEKDTIIKHAQEKAIGKLFSVLTLCNDPTTLSISNEVLENLERTLSGMHHEASRKKLPWLKQKVVIRTQTSTPLHPGALNVREVTVGALLEGVIKNLQSIIAANNEAAERKTP